MSFAQDVKKEVANLKVEEELLKAELYGLLKLKSELTSLIPKREESLLPSSKVIKRAFSCLFTLLFKALNKPSTAESFASNPTIFEVGKSFNPKV